ncbi:DUF4040 domain-containing protein [Candidatus Mcinerneyibacteriota bacterium]|nr:DUF4040 domain-containing protein [Candidatus Mcinerneyibacteriota bacterium]
MINPGLSSLFIFLVFVASLLAVEAKKAFRAVLFMSLAGLLTAVIFVLWKAPDVAMTEAAIGAGFTTFLFLMALNRIRGKEK